MTPLIVLTTVGAAFDAPALAVALVDQRLAACVQVIDRIHSVYRWEGRVVQDTEKLLIIKSSEERLEALKTELFARHPYEVPEFVVLEIDRIEGPYRDWLVSNL